MRKLIRGGRRGHGKRSWAGATAASAAWLADAASEWIGVIRRRRRSVDENRRIILLSWPVQWLCQWLCQWLQGGSALVET
ncbi:MAG: hypothetical protein ACKPJD_03645, partial [Planctomycetaceae bacterium]